MSSRRTALFTSTFLPRTSCFPLSSITCMCVCVCARAHARACACACACARVRACMYGTRDEGNSSRFPRHTHLRARAHTHTHTRKYVEKTKSHTLSTTAGSLKVTNPKPRLLPDTNSRTSAPQHMCYKDALQRALLRSLARHLVSHHHHVGKLSKRLLYVRAGVCGRVCVFVGVCRCLVLRVERCCVCVRALHAHGTSKHAFRSCSFVSTVSPPMKILPAVVLLGCGVGPRFGSSLTPPVLSLLSLGSALTAVLSSTLSPSPACSGPSSRAVSSSSAPPPPSPCSGDLSKPSDEAFDPGMLAPHSHVHYNPAGTWMPCSVTRLKSRQSLVWFGPGRADVQGSR